MKAFWIYTALRLGLLFGCYAVFSGIWWGIRGDDVLRGQDLFLVLVVSALVSSVLSVKFLAVPRQRFAAQVQARAERVSAKIEEVRGREDEAE